MNNIIELRPNAQAGSGPSDLSWKVPEIRPGPCQLRLIWHPFKLNEETQSFTFTVIVDNGAYQEVLDAFRSLGGVWLQPAKQSFFFMPWPPAAVHLLPIDPAVS